MTTEEGTLRYDTPSMDGGPMEQNSNGDWVKFECHAALQADREMLHKLIAKMRVSEDQTIEEVFEGVDGLRAELTTAKDMAAILAAELDEANGMLDVIIESGAGVDNNSKALVLKQRIKDILQRREKGGE